MAAATSTALGRSEGCRQLAKRADALLVSVIAIPGTAAAGSRTAEGSRCGGAQRRRSGREVLHNPGAGRMGLTPKRVGCLDAGRAPWTIEHRRTVNRAARTVRLPNTTSVQLKRHVDTRGGHRRVGLVGVRRAGTRRPRLEHHRSAQRQPQRCVRHVWHEHGGPHVAGAVALLLSRQARNGSDPPNANQVRAALLSSTSNFDGRFNSWMGFGALDVTAFLARFA